jgi:hypothetical protein
MALNAPQFTGWSKHLAEQAAHALLKEARRHRRPGGCEWHAYRPLAPPGDRAFELRFPTHPRAPGEVGPGGYPAGGLLDARKILNLG